jgi:cobyrinic acid a,c-diamide synthase
MERIDAIADLVAEHIALDAIRAAAAPTAAAPLAAPTIRPPGQRIAIARDVAFAFLYPHLLDGWRRAGAEIRFFSPLADEPPPDDCTACWLPGGYPELHAPRLAAAHCFTNGLRRFAETRPVHGECGGYMILGRSLEDNEGKTHPMAGLLPIATSIARGRLHLGYRRATWRVDTAFAQVGDTHLGHEFHYASIIAADGAALADMVDGGTDALPAAGHRQGNVSGTFFHLIA